MTTRLKSLFEEFKLIDWLIVALLLLNILINPETRFIYTAILVTFVCSLVIKRPVLRLIFLVINLSILCYVLYHTITS